MKKGNNLNTLKHFHDDKTFISERVVVALESLKKEGPEAWEYEKDFAKRCGLTFTHLGLIRDQFAKYIVPLRKSRRAGTKAMNAWFGDPKVAVKASKLLSV